MKEKIDRWVEEACVMGDDPLSGLQAIVEKNASEMNNEVVRRLVEAMNVKTFLDKKAMGEDMEQSFPIADAGKLCVKVVKSALEKCVPSESTKVATYGNWKEPEDHFVGCYGFGQDKLEFPVKESYNPSGYVWESKKAETYMDKTAADKREAQVNQDLVKYAAVTAADYLRRFKDMYSTNAGFVSELRYLYPDSSVLKAASLSTGSKSVPNTVTTYHEEFGKVEILLDKLASLLKKKDPSQESGVVKSAVSPRERAFFRGYGKHIQNEMNKKRKSGKKLDMSSVELEDLGYKKLYEKNLLDLEAPSKESPWDKARKELQEKQEELAQKQHQDAIANERAKAYMVNPFDKARFEGEKATRLYEKEVADEEQLLAKERAFVAPPVERGELEGQKLTWQHQRALKDLAKSKAKDRGLAQAERAYFGFKRPVEGLTSLIEAASRQDSSLQSVADALRENRVAQERTARDAYDRYPTLAGSMVRMAPEVALTGLSAGVNFIPRMGNLVSKVPGYGNMEKDLGVFKSVMWGDYGLRPADRVMARLLGPAIEKRILSGKDAAKQVVDKIKHKATFEGIVNDDYFDSADKKALLGIYRDASNLAPNIVKNPTIAGAILRSAHAHGTSTIDPATARDLVTMEKGWRESNYYRPKADFATYSGSLHK